MGRTPFNLVERRGEKPWWTVLLVGGPPDVFRKLQKKLAHKRAMALKYHWEYHKPRQYQNSVPVDVDFVLFIKDMFGHADEDALKKAAKKAKVPILSTQSEWSVMSGALSRHGIHEDMSKYEDIMLYLGTGYKKTHPPPEHAPETVVQPILPPPTLPPTPPPVVSEPAARAQVEMTTTATSMHEGILHLDVSHLPLGVLARAIRARLKHEGFEGVHITVHSETVETY
jgi:hypothetical protein